MERPKISLMGIQSGDHYLTDKLNEYSKYADYLENKLRDSEFFRATLEKQGWEIH